MSRVESGTGHVDAASRKAGLSQPPTHLTRKEVMKLIDHVILQVRSGGAQGLWTLDHSFPPQPQLTREELLRGCELAARHSSTRYSPY